MRGDRTRGARGSRRRDRRYGARTPGARRMRGSASPIRVEATCALERSRAQKSSCTRGARSRRGRRSHPPAPSSRSTSPSSRRRRRSPSHLRPRRSRAAPAPTRKASRATTASSARSTTRVAPVSASARSDRARARSASARSACARGDRQLRVRSAHGLPGGLEAGLRGGLEAWDRRGENYKKTDAFVEKVTTRAAKAQRIADSEGTVKLRRRCRKSGIVHGACAALDIIQNTCSTVCWVDGELVGKVSAASYCEMAMTADGPLDVPEWLRGPLEYAGSTASSPATRRSSAPPARTPARPASASRSPRVPTPAPGTRAARARAPTTSLDLASLRNATRSERKAPRIRHARRNDGAR
jgi:hypothetical protein